MAKTSYDDFCDRVGPMAFTWLDALPDELRALALHLAWDNCAYATPLTDARIAHELTKARNQLTTN